MKLTKAFAKYGARLKNVNWSVSAENDGGELVVSLWQQYFGRPSEGKIKYVDRVSRWSGHGKNEFRQRIEKAFQTGQPVRVVIATTDDPAAVDEGKDASKLKNDFHVKEGWLGKVVLWDGENYEIEFLTQASV